MKLRSLIFYLIFINHCFALKGTVIVFKTPMFRRPDINSKIISYFKKGQMIKVHGKHKTVGPTDIDYGIDLKDDHPSFYAMVDSTGTTAYILKQHLKLIYNDFREFDKPIKAHEGHDPSDYRLLEPLPKNYPLNKSDRYRILYSAGLGPSNKFNYPYENKILASKFKNKLIGNLVYISKTQVDKHGRIFFGISGTGVYEDNEFKFSDGISSFEKSVILSLGPIITYDLFRSESHLVTISGGIDVNYNIQKISQFYTEYDSDVRSFRGIFFTPRFSTSFIKRVQNIHENFAFFAKIHLGFDTPYTLSPTSKTNNYRDLWNSSSDKLDFPLKGNLHAVLGIQYSSL